MRSWVGAWPPPSASGLSVVATEARLRAGWDGVVRAVLGVVAADGGGVVGVQPGMPAGEVDSVRAAAALIGVRLWEAAFRWSDSPAPLPDRGSWVPPDAEGLPEWLRPFGLVLAEFDDAGFVAGVGVKQHDRWGWELSVGTEPRAQGRGLARGLVATAARRALDEGAQPTYLHDFRNVASAKVAEAAGFPDRGWKAVGSSAG